MDATLGALVQAAERGDDVPRVQVALGSALVTGVPISHAEYAELQQQSIQVGLAKARKTRLKRREAAMEEVKDESVPLAAFVKTPADGTALVLKDVALLLGTGEAVRARTMRVPVEQIELWWAGAYDVEKAKGGMGFFVGGVVPIDLGN